MIEKKTPGKRLDEIRKTLKLPKTTLAERLEIAPNTLYAVLNGKKRIDPKLAARLGQLHRDTAYWLSLQHAWDLGQAESRR
jgi:addiction module HigA family antidote